MKKGQKVWFWWSASEVYSVRFIRWKRMRMGNGKEDTNKLGVGVIVYSDWLFSSPLFNRRQRRGLNQGYCAISPYIDLYSKNPRYHLNAHNIIKRPKIERVR